MNSIIAIFDRIQDREKIKTLVSSQNDMELKAVGKDGYDAVKLGKLFKPDIAILDSCVAFFNGVEVPHLLKRHSPSTSIIMLCSLEDRDLMRLTESGTIAAYLLRDADMESITAIIRKVRAGEPYVNSALAARVFWMLTDRCKTHSLKSKTPVNKAPFPMGLSRTEMRILAFIAEGCRNKEIAEKLKLKDGTVRNCISSAIRKAGLKNRTQAAVYALRNGLVAS
ncbi:MAG: response regulator transcription factor [Treponema sp.]|jgi:DNA-binding NarL/FixJ family response regulator|nr:response regulator transcription factor [Treponema sp.]